MAPIILPKLPKTAEFEIAEISFARDMRPSTGGPSQRQDRLGTRHAIQVSVPMMKYGWCGAGVAADLAVARTGDGALIQIPEPKVPKIAYGTFYQNNPAVDGAGQLGKNIKLKMLIPGVVIKKGKWLSLYAGGRWFAYFTTAEVTVDGSGVATLPIYPMIRRSPLDNARVELVDPVIQGLTKDPVQRKLNRLGGLGFDFIIEETE